MQETPETWVQSLSQKAPLKEEKAHSNILAWKNPMARGAWWATVNGVMKNQTHLVTEHAEIFTEVFFLRKFLQIVFLILKNLLQVN